MTTTIKLLKSRINLFTYFFRNTSKSSREGSSFSTSSSSSSISNISSNPSLLPPSVLIIRVLEQLAILLADPSLSSNVCSNSTQDQETQSSAQQASKISVSAPSSRRESVASSPNNLSRYTSEPSLATTLPPSGVTSSHGDRDLRRRIAKQLVEFKRILEKDGLTFAVDSHMYKAIFSKSSPTCGILVLLKCLKVKYYGKKKKKRKKKKEKKKKH